MVVLDRNDGADTVGFNGNEGNDDDDEEEEKDAKCRTHVQLWLCVEDSIWLLLL